MQGKAWGGGQRLEAMSATNRRQGPPAPSRQPWSPGRGIGPEHCPTLAKIIEFMVLQQPLEGRRINTDEMTDLTTLAATLLSNFVTIRLRRCEQLWTWPVPDPPLQLYCKLLQIAL